MSAAGVTPKFLPSSSSPCPGGDVQRSLLARITRATTINDFRVVMNPKQPPGLGNKRVVSCKDSFHGTDLLAVSEHAPWRVPWKESRDTTRLYADIAFPAPENVGTRAKNDPPVSSVSMQGS